MKKSPVKVKLRYFPVVGGTLHTDARYVVIRIDGRAFVWHPAKTDERLHVGDSLDENEAEKLSTDYNVVTVL